MKAVLLAAAALPAALLAQAPAPGDWPVFGYDAGSSRFSPLDQITPANVAGLKVAWKYDMRPPDVPKPDKARLEADAYSRWKSQQGPRGVTPTATPAAPAMPAPQGAAAGGAAGASPAAPAGPPAPSSASQVTPIVIANRMYFGTPFGRVVALDATTGKELWVLPLPGNEQPALRGLAYWPGEGANGPRLVVTTRSNKVLTIDVASGKVNSSYGLLNLRTPEVMGNFPNGNLTGNAMPVLYKNLMIIGSRGQEQPVKGPRGDVRAFDIVTGKLAWTFHAIPEPGEPNFGSWEGDGWKDRAGVDVWNSPTVDAERGIVYLGFGTPASDRDGTTRPGAGLYGTSLVAVDANTGKYLWHFQTVHHDLWDRDMTGIPTLIEVRRGGRLIPAVAAINKQSLLFVLDRVTGKPLFDVREVPVPPSEAPGEKAWPTQPVPAKPAPLARQSIDVDTELSDVTPEHAAWCRNWVKQLGIRSTTQYTPIGFTAPTVYFPGSGGGMNWWGGAFDRKHGLYIVNTANQGSVEQLRRTPDGQLQSMFSANSWFAEIQPQGALQCQKGPWGEIMGVDVATGTIRWRHSFGVTDWLPEGKRETGRVNAGGPIVTAGGLVFIAATDDKRFRAYDSATGKQLWEARLDAAGHATPLTYLGANGKQYVSLIATGGSYMGDPPTSDDLVTFALP